MRQERKPIKSNYTSLTQLTDSSQSLIHSSCNLTQLYKNQGTSFSSNPNDNLKLLNKTSKSTYSSRIQKLLCSCDSQKNKSFEQLFQLYDHQPSLFIQFTKPIQSDSARFIFSFVLSIAKFHKNMPFFCQHKIVNIFQNLFKLLSQSTLALTQQQLSILEQTSLTSWNSVNLISLQLILQNLLTYCMQFSILLAKRPNQNELVLSQKLFSLFLQQLVFHIQRHKTKSSYFKQILSEYVDSMFTSLPKIQTKYCKVLPLYDITALSLVSLHHQFFKMLLLKVTKYLEIQKQQNKGLGPKDQDLAQMKESSQTINKVFYNCSFFNFSSVFSLSGQSHYVKEVVVAIIIYFRQTLLFILDELEKIQKSSIPHQIIRWIFNFAKLGNTLSQRQELKQIINNLIASPKILQNIIHLLAPKKHCDSSEQYSSQVFKSAQMSLFQLFYKIEKQICHFNLQIYMDLYIESPCTFRSSYFIQNLFKLQHFTIILSFMSQFTQRWLSLAEKPFDYQFYLLHFLKKCISKDNLHSIGEFFKCLNYQLRLKMSLIIYKLSFQDQTKKTSLPQPSDYPTRLAQLTSAGFGEKFLIVNKLFPDFSQQLVMKQIIHNIFPAQHYLFVKAFYHVIHYQFDLNQTNFSFIQKLIDSFYESVMGHKVQQAYSIFHLFNCICFRDKSSNKLSDKYQSKLEGKMLKILLVYHNQISTMCERTCQSRREAMSHLTLSQEMISSNFKYFQKIKRMHCLFIKNLVFWFNHLTFLQEIFEPSISYQQAKEIYQKFAKEVLYAQYHFLHYIERFCSQKHFSNILQIKIKQKMAEKAILSVDHLLILFEVIFSFVKSCEYTLHNFPLAYLNNILQYLGFLLQTKLTLTNQRQLLKKKLITLQFIQELLHFFTNNPQHHLSESFNFYFKTCFRESIMQIALQNPDYVQKYQRELIMHLRVASLKIVLLYYKTKFEVLVAEHLFAFLFESCFDKNLQVRLMLLNIFTSRFKNQQYSRILQSQQYIISYLTCFAMFQPELVLNLVAKKIIQTIKNVANDDCFFGLNILLYSIKLLITWFRQQLLSKKYDIFVDTFLKAFDQLWLTKKQSQYSVYAFSETYIKTKRIAFIIQEVNYHSHIMPYIFDRKSDFQLENIIKKYIQKPTAFQFQLTSQDSQLNPTERLIGSVLYNLPYRIFSRVKQLIQQKSRNSRILKSKKDILINWETLQQERIVSYEQSPGRNYQVLDLFLKID